ncbi:MAG: hypothetical protein KC591_07455 [Gemmatimonadetes bacterium]|nr:hypothetical protein [Gemmatimonadota bacterium]
MRTSLLPLAAAVLAASLATGARAATLPELAIALTGATDVLVVGTAPPVPALEDPAIRRALWTTTTDPRAALAGEDPAELVIVLCPRPGGAGGVLEPHGEGSIYTEEAFAEFWARVRPGGTLAWLAADEVVFLRGLLAQWEARRAETGGERATPATDGFGWRLVQDAAPESPYRLLGLLRRTPSAADLAAVAARARSMPLRELFGPGADVRSRFVPLADPEGPASARALLFRQFSAAEGRPVVVDAARDDGPLVFETLADRSAWENGTLALGSLGLLAIWLLPLAARRRVDAPTPDVVPVAVRLAEPGVVLALATVGGVLALRWATFRPGAFPAVGAVPTAAIVGFLLAARAASGARFAFVGGIGAVAAVTLATFGAPVDATLRLVFATAQGLAFGLAAGAIASGARGEAPEDHRLWMSLGMLGALFLAPAIAVRLVHETGVRAAAWILAAAWVLVTLLRLGLAAQSRKRM